MSIQKRRVLMPLMKGFEEMEAVILLDVLRRGDLEVVTWGVEEKQVCGAHGIPIVTDSQGVAVLEEEWDLVLLPGGIPGAHHLRDHPGVQALLVAQIAKGKFVGAICAAPVALQAAGILEGQLVTAYPGFESELSGALFMEERVVDSGQIMTSRGPGTAFEFALYLVSKFVSAKKSEEIAKAMLL